MGIRVGLFVFIALAVAPEAQETTRPATRVVSGVVRDAVTRAPIAGARVRAAAFNHEWCEPCLANYGLVNTITDSAGRFSIDDAPKTFVLEADQTGYAEGGFGIRRPVGRAARIDLAPGQRLDDLEILLFREAVITGRVTDETGAPAAGLHVEVSRIDARGRSTWSMANSTEGDPYRPVTDATGRYTAYVAPDEYAVAAIRGSVPVFHPSVEHLQSAALVTVDPGEVLTGIDVQLPPARLGRVSGRFQIPADPQAVRMAPSMSMRNARFEIRGRVDGDRFVVNDVPYGDYSLEVRSSRFRDRTVQGNLLLEWWARVPVRVDSTEVELGDVPPQPALVVSGVVTSPGAKTADDWSTTSVELHARDEDDMCGRIRSRHSVSNGGDFTATAMPGEFRLCAWPHNRFGRGEATLNGQDIVDLPFTVSGNVRDVRVLLPAEPGRLRGNVHGRDGRPVREGWIVVFPSDRRYWAHAVAEGGRFAAARVSVAGSFEIDTLLPAEYLVAAVDDASMDGWPMESWLARAAKGATRATLGRSETRTLLPISVRTIPVERAPVRESRRSIDGAFAVDPSRPDLFTIEGVVSDAAGRPVPHASVTAVPTSFVWMGPEPVFADQAGRYRLIGFHAGEYTIRAEADVPFKTEPVAVRAAGRLQPMIVTELHEVQMKVGRNDVLNFRLERTQRPSFHGEWALDGARSSATGGGRGAVDTPGGGRGGGLGLGPSAESLRIFHTAESLQIEERRGAASSRIIYSFDRRDEIALSVGRNAGTTATMFSRWQGSRVVTTITLPATAVGGATTYEETRWLETDGSMVVEVRRPGEPNLRRTVYLRRR